MGPYIFEDALLRLRWHVIKTELSRHEGVSARRSNVGKSGLNHDASRDKKVEQQCCKPRTTIDLDVEDMD